MIGGLAIANPFEQTTQMMQSMLTMAQMPTLMNQVQRNGQTIDAMGEYGTLMTQNLVNDLKRAEEAKEYEAKTKELQAIKAYLKEIGKTDDELHGKTYDQLKEMVK